MNSDEILASPAPRVWFQYGRWMEWNHYMKKEILEDTDTIIEDDFESPEYIAESIIPPEHVLRRMGINSKKWLEQNGFEPISDEILRKYGHG